MGRRGIVVDGRAGHRQGRIGGGVVAGEGEPTQVRPGWEARYPQAPGRSGDNAWRTRDGLVHSMGTACGTRNQFPVEYAADLHKHRARGVQSKILRPVSVHRTAMPRLPGGFVDNRPTAAPVEGSSTPLSTGVDGLVLYGAVRATSPDRGYPPAPGRDDGPGRLRRSRRGRRASWIRRG